LGGNCISLLRFFFFRSLRSSWLLCLRWSCVWLDLRGVFWLFDQGTTSSTWSALNWGCGWSRLTKLGEEVVHLGLLIFDFLGSFLEKADLELIINERDDHFIMQGDHI